MANRNSTTTVPPSSVPMLRPMTVMSVRELGRRQWRNRMYRSDRPLARADRTKSSCSVFMTSERTTRVYTAISMRASESAGRITVLRLSSSPLDNRFQPVAGSQPSFMANT